MIGIYVMVNVLVIYQFHDEAGSHWNDANISHPGFVFLLVEGLICTANHSDWLPTNLLSTTDVEIFIWDAKAISSNDKGLGWFGIVWQLWLLCEAGRIFLPWRQKLKKPLQSLSITYPIRWDGAVETVLYNSGLSILNSLSVSGADGLSHSSKKDCLTIYWTEYATHLAWLQSALQALWFTCPGFTKMRSVRVAIYFDIKEQ